MSDTIDDAWSVSAKKALTFSFVRPTEGKSKPIASFRPAHAYAIFGDSEQIFGYKGLNINLSFHASDMRPNLRVKYSDKYTPTGDTEATDVEEVLREFLPPVAFEKRKDFETAVHQARADWTPPGKLNATFTKNDVTYEVWKGSLVDLAVKQLVQRIQIFVPTLIEGGTYIPIGEPGSEADEDRWSVFFLYQKKSVPGEADRFEYTFNGYSTVYRFFLFQTPTPPASPSKDNGVTTKLEDLDLKKEDFDLSDLPCRTRISQFIILPPFQGKGLGPKLYDTIFQEYLRHPQTVEITVEDPNEAFDDMRDIADLHFLRQQPDFNALYINTSLVINKDGMAPNNIVDRDAAEAVRRKAKIAPRQFARVLEMHLMSKLPKPVRPGFEPDVSAAKATKEQEHEYKLWHLMAKKRIYRHNKDALGELEIPERIAKLNDTVASVAFDYARLLLKAENYEEVESKNANGKRKAGTDVVGADTKKQRV